MMLRKLLVVFLMVFMVLVMMYFISLNYRYKVETHEPDSDLKGISTLLDGLISELSNNKSNIESIEENNSGSIRDIKKRLDGIDLALSNLSLNDETDVEEPEKERVEENDLNSFILSEKEAYEAEFIDFSWAPEAESHLEYALEELTQHLEFDLIDSECRTTRCSATVNFESYELATENGAQLAEISLPGLNCAKSIMLPVPGDLSARYQADLILDCSQQIQGLVQLDY